MHGTIIHYDPLTQCGLLRTEAGQLQYFRRDEVVSEGLVAPGQPVALRNGILVDTGGSQHDASLPIRPPQRPVSQPANMAVGVSQARSGWNSGWIGSVLSAGALILLMLSGGQQNQYASDNPRLVDSIFGTVAAVLLVLEAILFISAAGSRRRLRWTFWLTAWASLFAYVGQTFDGFEADEATGWYGYALLALGFAVYILPYRK